MGLAHRVIPTLLCKGRSLVKGERFNPWRSVGLAVQGVRVNANRGVDELVLLDVSAWREARTIDPELVREITDILYAPIAVGGGIRTVEHVRALLRAGADKVVIRSGGYDAVRAVSEAVGRQAVVASLDASSLDYDWPGVARKWEAAGAGEILLTRMEREGLMCGYDLELIRTVSAAVSIPVIAHGGCSGYVDMLDAIHAGASAVAAGALFQFTDCTPRGAALYLAEHGIEARI